ncbi:MAG: hypothetical protein ACM3JI_05700 [Anaerolineae bacterium]
MAGAVKHTNNFFFRQAAAREENHPSRKFHRVDPASQLYTSPRVHFKDRAVSKAGTDPLSPKPSNFSSIATGTADVTSDLSFILRGIANLGVDSPALTLMGISTAFNFFQGLVVTDQISRKIVPLQQVSDHKGETIAKIGLARGVCQTTAGGTFIGVRLLTFIDQLKAGPGKMFNAPYINPHKTVVFNMPTGLLSRAAFFLGVIGTALFGLFYFIIGVECSLNVHWGRRFKQQLNQSFDAKRLDHPQELAKGIKFLQDKLLLTKSDQELAAKIERNLVRKYGRDRNKIAQSLREEALVAMTQLVAMAAEKQGKVLSLDHCQKTALKILSLSYKKLSSTEREKKIDEDLQTLGKKVLIDKYRTKAEMKVTRLTSRDCVEGIKKTFDAKLTEHLIKGEDCDQTHIKQAVDLISKVKESIDVAKIINSLLVAACVIGVIATVLTLVFTFATGPGWLVLILIPILAILPSSIMLVTDTWCLELALKSGQAKHDQKYILLQMLIGAVCLVGGIAVTSLFSFGTVPLIVACVIGGLWLLENAIMLYQLNKKREEKIGALEELKQLLAEKASSERLRAAVDKFSVEEQNALYFYWSKHRRRNHPRLKRPSKTLISTEAFFKQKPSRNGLRYAIKKMEEDLIEKEKVNRKQLERLHDFIGEQLKEAG